MPRSSEPSLQSTLPADTSNSVVHLFRTLNKIITNLFRDLSPIGDILMRKLLSIRSRLLTGLFCRITWSLLICLPPQSCSLETLGWTTTLYTALDIRSGATPIFWHGRNRNGHSDRCGLPHSAMSTGGMLLKFGGPARSRMTGYALNPNGRRWKESPHTATTNSFPALK